MKSRIEEKQKIFDKYLLARFSQKEIDEIKQVNSRFLIEMYGLFLHKDHNCEVRCLTCDTKFSSLFSNSNLYCSLKCSPLGGN